MFSSLLVEHVQLVLTTRFTVNVNNTINVRCEIVNVRAQTSLNLQNMYLYLYGIALNVGGFSVVSGLLSAFYSSPGTGSPHSLAGAGSGADQQSAAQSFFAGYTWLTWTIILTQACSVTRLHSSVLFTTMLHCYLRILRFYGRQSALPIYLLLSRSFIACLSSMIS